jgi:hypothetical protein
MSDLDPPFSVDEYFAKRVDPRWELLKEQGNVLFKKGDFKESVRVYTQALNITLGSLKSIPTLVITLKRHKKGTAQRRVSQNPLIFVMISRFLPPPLTDSEFTLFNGEKVTVRLPNLPAAVCYSNRSAAYMKLASAVESNAEAHVFLKKALRDATSACRNCPAYAKGHFRVFQALKCLGHNAAANQKKHQLALHEHYAANMPWPAIAGLAIGWLSLAEFQLVYSTVRFQEALRRIKKNPPDTFLSQASLVPFLGGQFLMIGINYISADWKKVTLNSLYFVCTDESGAEELERPPFGYASKTSMMAVRSILVLFFQTIAYHGTINLT